MKKINNESSKLNYSIFNENTTDDEILSFFSKILLSLAKNKHGDIVLLHFYYILSEEENLIHVGLVLSNNKKNNKYLMYYMIIYGSYFLHKERGSFVSTTLTTTPKIIEFMHKEMSGVEPALNRSDKSKKNIKYINILRDKYLIPILTNGRAVEIDYRNYLVKLSEKEDIGFVDDYYSQAKAHNMKYNLFALSSVDYTNGQDLIMIGNYNWRCRIKHYFILAYLRREI